MIRATVRTALIAGLLVGLAACSSAGGEPTTVSSPATSSGDQTATQPPATEAGSESGARAFRIDPTQSEVRFNAHEILGGNPNVAVGVNSEISGDLEIDFAHPQESKLGPIEIDAASFATDNGLRDQAIRQFILQSNRFPTITFDATDIVGIPDQVKAGDTLNLQISGDLTLHGVTKNVTFDAQVTLVSTDQLQGSASGTILRSDFGLVIPNVPRVAGVEEAVELEFDFVAVSA